MIKRIFCALFALTLAALTPVCAAEIEVSGKSAIVVEADTGDVIYEKNSSDKLPMASTTKIMTALVAIESCDIDKKVTVSEEAAGIEGSSIYLKAGEKLTMKELLYALMLESANDAAAAIAVEIAGDIDSFADMMNAKAEEIGLKNTHFTNPHGLDNEAHYTTAYDLAALTCYAMKNETFAQIVSTYKYTIPMMDGEGTRLLLNHNRLLKSYDGATGVKTGFTKKSGRCLVTAAEREGVRLVAVTLSDPNDWRDHTELLDYGFSVYKSVTLARSGELSFDIPCTGGTEEFVCAANRDELTVPIRESSGEIKCRIEMLHGRFLFAPVDKDRLAAYAVFMADGEEIGRLPLYTQNKVTAKETPKKLFGIF